MKKTIRNKVAYVISACLGLFIIFSIVLSYLFYDNAVKMSSSGIIYETQTQFFIVYSCAEVIMGILVVVLITALANGAIAKPIKKLNNVLAETAYKEDTAENKLLDDDISQKIKDLNINSGDEIEELYHTVQKMQLVVRDYVISQRGQSWDSEHDSMTMLNNKSKFEKRKEEVYPFAKSIYIACLDVINMSVVNSKLSTQAGDSIISKVARELRRISSDNIHTYRIQEDIFMVVFCGYSEDESVEMMKQWNQRVGRLNRASDSFECRLVWGGSYGEGDFDVEDICKRADAEMYCQKMIMKKELVNL